MGLAVTAGLPADGSYLLVTLAGEERDACHLGRGCRVLRGGVSLLAGRLGEPSHRRWVSLGHLRGQRDWVLPGGSSDHGPDRTTASPPQRANRRHGGVRRGVYDLFDLRL